MGIIKAGISAVGGTLADQWLETIEPGQMDNETLASYGVMVRAKDSRRGNKKGTEDIVSNGSIIHVPANTFMLLVDGGKIIAATDESGYYQVDNSRSPSIFFHTDKDVDISEYGNTGRNTINRPGGIKNTLKDSWERFKFGGTTPAKQSVIYINKQEINNIRFGTKNPIPYTDRVLVQGRLVPCKITSFGTYSIKIGDPLLFYSEVCGKIGKKTLHVSDLAEQYINEFLMAYQTSLASLSADNVCVSDIAIKTMEIGEYMAQALDNEWLSKRGFYIQSVGIAGLSYDERTEQLLDKYANDSILFDANARAARMTAGLSSGIESAGSNSGGSMLGLASMNMGMNLAGSMMNMPNQQTTNVQQTPNYQPPQNAPQEQNTLGGWTCTCNSHMNENTNFCSNCGNKKPEEKPVNSWKCTCGYLVENGNFCSNCGNKKPVKTTWICVCGNEANGLFCSQCGNKKSDKFKCNKCAWMPEDPTNPPKFCPNCGDVFNELDRD